MSTKRCPDCGTELVWDEGDPGCTTGPPDSWVQPDPAGWYCPNCGTDQEGEPPAGWYENGSGRTASGLDERPTLGVSPSFADDQRTDRGAAMLKDVNIVVPKDPSARYDTYVSHDCGNPRCTDSGHLSIKMGKPTKRPCTCGNPEWGFDCACVHAEAYPGNTPYTCEFCGIYNASRPKCSNCVVDDSMTQVPSPIPILDC